LPDHEIRFDVPVILLKIKCIVSNAFIECGGGSNHKFCYQEGKESNCSPFMFYLFVVIVVVVVVLEMLEMHFGSINELPVHQVGGVRISPVRISNNIDIGLPVVIFS
jgi:hypothetical protein